MPIDVSLGRAVLDLVTDPTKLRAGMAAARAETLSTVQGAQRALHNVGMQMTATGGQMVRGITAPVVAAGAAIFNVAGDFETSMAHIVGLVGVGRDTVQRWVPEIEALGEATGKGPNELARALYFITSAGIPANRVMEALSASARAAAAGLGETEVVADAVTSAMNAYQKAGLTASQATDVLTAAVKYGKAEASTIAPVLGRLLPVASAMNISFAQVAGTLATMTVTGLDAAEAATSIGAIMSTLLKPSTEGAKALAAVGLSMADLRDLAAKEPDGLVQVMRLLDLKFRDNDEALTKVIPNIRAFRGVMNVLAQDTKQVDTVLTGVAEAAGMTDKAFAAVADTAQFKIDQAISRMQSDLIDLGATVLPFVVKAIDGLVDVVHEAVDWFDKLPPSTQGTIVQLLAFAAVVGPILIVLGSIVGAISSLVAAGLALSGFVAGTLIPILTGALIAALEGVATVIFATEIPALQSLALAIVGLEAAGAPLLLVLGALVVVGGAIATVLSGAGTEVEQLDRKAHLMAQRRHIDLEDARRQLGLTADGTRLLDAAWREEQRQAELSADAVTMHTRAMVAASERADAVAADTAKVARAYGDSVQPVVDYWAAQREYLTKSLADERKYTAEAVTAMKKFRTDMEAVFKDALDAKMDASDTALAIAEKQAELAEGDKEYKALKHATALQTQEYANRRMHILAELAELKLHAALIGTAMDREVKLVSLLTSKDMHDGLTSKNPETQASYEALRGQILDQLQVLATSGGPAAKGAMDAIAKYLDPSNPQAPLHDAGAWGAATLAAYIYGMSHMTAAQRNSVYGVIHGLVGAFKATSPPGPESPLHEIDKWGERTGMAWVLPLVGAVARARDLVMSPLSGLASHLGSVGFGAPGLQVAAAALSAGPSGLSAPPAGGHRDAPLIGSLHQDLRGYDDPKAVADAARQGVEDALAGALRDQSLRYVGGTKP